MRSLTPFRALGVHDLRRHQKGEQYAGAITVVQRFEQGDAVVAHVAGAYSYNVNLRVNDPVSDL